MRTAALPNPCHSKQHFGAAFLWLPRYGSVSSVGLSSSQGYTSKACAMRSILLSDTFQRERSTAET